jgi:hypothetical protein
MRTDFALAWCEVSPECAPSMRRRWHICAVGIVIIVGFGRVFVPRRRICATQGWAAVRAMKKRCHASTSAPPKRAYPFEMNTIQRPFLPSDRYGSSSRPSDSLVRAVVAKCISAAGGGSADMVLKERWPRDEVARSFITTRTATTPTTTATANALLTTATGDMLLSIGPQSAASQLFAQGLMLDFGRSQTISVPNVLSAATFSNIVAEGSPIPVYEVRSGPSTLLTLQTIKGICIFTRELEPYLRAVYERCIGEVKPGVGVGV